MHVGKINIVNENFQTLCKGITDGISFSDLDIVMFVLRPHLALSRSQTSPFHGNMRTLFGYMIP